ncbi:hypothetical protein C8F01DRAFT_1110452 [Mycena amicta]|nr:hypothetical protein C8F01DRAFT_1110452 [Mycena amicta]
MPGKRHRRQLNLSNLFGGGHSTTTADAVSSGDAATPTSSSDNGGILGELSSILNPATSSPATSDSPATSPTSTTTSPVSDTQTEATSTVFSTSTAASHASITSVAASSSASGSNDSSTQTSKVAAAVVGSLVGILGLAMVIAFFLRRWNRQKRRVARESINFPQTFSPSQPPVPPKNEAVEQKEVYVDAVNVPYRFPGAPVYPEDVGFHQQPQVYSPRPFHGYTSDAQRVMYEYRGQDSQYPNPHPPPPTHNAYGGM